MFDLQKVDQGHGVQFSQIHHSMADINMSSSRFALALIVCEKLKFLTFDLENVGQGHT